MAIDALAVYLQVPSLSVTVADLGSTETLQTLDVLRSLLSALSHERRRLPIHAVKMLEHSPIPGGEISPIYFMWTICNDVCGIQVNYSTQFKHCNETLTEIEVRFDLTPPKARL